MLASAIRTVLIRNPHFIACGIPTIRWLAARFPQFWGFRSLSPNCGLTARHRRRAEKVTIPKKTAKLIRTTVSCRVGRGASLAVPAAAEFERDAQMHSGGFGGMVVYHDGVVVGHVNVIGEIAGGSQGVTARTPCGWPPRSRSRSWLLIKAMRACPEPVSTWKVAETRRAAV